MSRDHNSTIPPNRNNSQRDYRARREQYVVDLEARIRRTEQENNQLRGELAATQASQHAASPPFDPRAEHASSELMQSLSVASASLARYHQLAFVERRDSHGAHQSPPAGQSHSSSSRLPAEAANTSRHTQLPSSAPPPISTSNASTSGNRSQHPPQGKRPRGEDSQGNTNGHSGDASKKEYKDDSKDGSGSSKNAGSTRR